MKIEVTRTPDKDDLDKIGYGLRRHNEIHLGPKAGEELRFAVFARNDQGDVIGGVRAAAGWDWMNLEVVWVEERERGKGIGRELLQAAETFAVENEVFSVCTETASFQALEFYQHQGYELFGQLEDYPIGHTMFYLKKSLKGRLR